MQTVEVVGRGPAVDALTAFLADIDVTVAQPSTPANSSGDLAVVVDTVGSETFAAWNDRAKGDDVPWVAVELGGVGGVPVTDAAISGFGPETGCFDCLRTRVEATVDETEEITEAPAAATQRFTGALAGRLVTQFLDGDTALFGTVTELPHTQRRFLPVPGCDCSETPSRTLGDGRRTAPDSEALSRAELGLDDRVGIATEVGEVESFPAPYYLSTLAETAGFSDVSAAAKRRCCHRLGHGVHESAGRELRAVRGRGLPRKESAARDGRRCSGCRRTRRVRQGRGRMGRLDGASLGPGRKSADRRTAVASRRDRPLSAAIERG